MSFNQFDNLDEDPLDLSFAAPQPRKIDKTAAQAAAELSEQKGYHSRRGPAARQDVPQSQPTPETPKPPRNQGRVKISDLLGEEGKIDGLKAQLNFIAPADLISRFAQTLRNRGEPSRWQLLEKSLDALDREGEGAEASGDQLQLSPDMAIALAHVIKRISAEGLAPFAADTAEADLAYDALLAVRRFLEEGGVHVR